MKRFLSALLCMSLVFGLTACGGSGSADNTNSPSPSPSDEVSRIDTEALSRYETAMDGLLASTDLVLELEVTTTRTVQGRTLTESSEETVTYLGLQTDSPAALREQELTYYEDLTLDYEYLYTAQGIALDAVGGQFFIPVAEGDDPLASLLPIALLDTALYGEVSANDGTVECASPSAPESWLCGEAAELLSASASAKLTDDGALDSILYTAKYVENAVTVELSVEMDVKSKDTSPELDTHVSPDGRIELPDVRVVELFCRAALVPSYSTAQTNNVSNTYTVAAGALVMSETAQVDVFGKGMSLRYQCETSQTIYEGNQTYQQNVLETFSNGTYVVNYNGEEYKQSISASQLDPAGSVIPFLMTPDKLETVTVTEIDGYLVMDFTLQKSTGEELQSYLCESLYGDPKLLSGMASRYTTKEIGGYLSFDLSSMLPTGYSLDYLGQHVISGQTYPIGLNHHVTFDLASSSAYQTLTGETFPETQTQPAPTPLFYKVSGPAGETMWLFGTIHVGDERTAALPDAIWDALASSDALATEIDYEAFEAAMEAGDTTLINAISKAYYYSGSTTADHMDKELYEAALLAMKATGEYNSTYSDMLKVSLWDQAISNSFLYDSSSLCSEKGVEERLNAFAKANGIEHREVESTLFQIQMSTGFSDPLQEMRLGETLNYSRGEYAAESEHLFDLWCSGDEAALTAYITDEEGLDELTAEELALYEEYNKAMMTDRNAGMLATAIQYMDNGEVIFFAVGLAHLLGDDGLVQGLRDAGYTVELVK